MKTGYLIDWMTLRIPLGEKLGHELSERVRSCLNMIHCVNRDGEIVWKKMALDIDALRSDTTGICWMVQGDGKEDYLTIGASPASLEHGLNVFGSCDVRHCAQVMIREASIRLKAILPKNLNDWQCRRMDITGNFLLPDAESVKQALRQLSVSDGGRRKATNKTKGGDSVYWNPTSDLRKGKAYHKGPQMAYLRSKGQLDISDELIELGNRILRLEHTLSARWFRRLSEDSINWFDLSVECLENLYRDFFRPIVDGVEVSDMGRYELVKRIQDSNAITEGRALAAFTTYRNIRQDGFDVVKGYMNKSTWYLHLKYLRTAGISDADLHCANIYRLKPVKIVIAKPVSCWDDIRKAA